MSDSLRIAAAQLNLLVGDMAGNAARMTAAAEAAVRDGASLVVFSELSITGYPPEDLLLRSDFIAQAEVVLHRFAVRVGEVAPNLGVIVGAPRRERGKLFNSVFYLRDGAVAAHYDKTALPNYSVFDEKRYFDAGIKACVIPVNGVRVGLTVCEDIWRRAGAAVRAKQAGAEVLLNLNASPFHLGKDAQRSAVLQARTAEVGLPIVYVNQVGGQDELVFDGDSRVVAADGGLVYAAPLFEEDIVCFDCCGDGRIECRRPSRTELSQTEVIWRALVLGLRDYIDKNPFSGVVVGLSGGIDSAVTLALAVAAFGAEKVAAVMMPSRYTADMSIEDSRILASNLGVDLHEIDIEPIFEAMQRQLEELFAGLPGDVTEENMQARVRGDLLMAIANKRRCAVIATSNKSEVAVGYTTLYGDMVGAYAPLKDVVKTRVYALARFCNRNGESIPRRVIDRPPSAELAPGQTDQDSLPPYKTLDAVIEEFIESDTSYDEMVARGFCGDTVRKVQAMVMRNEYKRRQAPPGVRITEKAFGRDRRHPITSGAWFASNEP